SETRLWASVELTLSSSPHSSLLSSGHSTHQAAPGTRMPEVPLGIAPIGFDRSFQNRSKQTDQVGLSRNRCSGKPRFVTSNRHKIRNYGQILTYAHLRAG
uniref:Uncharacterized protein n=1 Tax=Nothobranchius furzeri TaxID=105023 RepID=A0A8C6P7P6_NOTFU